MRIEDLARSIGACVEGDAQTEIDGIAPIDEAGPRDLTVLLAPRYRSQLASTRAAAILVASDAPSLPGRTLLRAADPYRAFARLLALFDSRSRPAPGIHPTAVIADSARVGQRAYVGPYVVIGERVTIGDDARIYPHVTIYPDARIGDRFTAHAGAVVREAVRIGDDVVLQPGVVVGGDGFGYIPQVGSSPQVIPQIGTVELGSRVEIGANTTVDRAAIGATRVGDDVKLDNLVMVAHGCRIGSRSLLAAQTGLAGSTELGNDVMTGGQAGFAGHCRIGDRVRVAAQSGVAGDVDTDATVAGSPAVAIGVWRRSVAAFQRLPEVLRRLRALERRVAEDR